jgi:hypothetical protein
MLIDIFMMVILKMVKLMDLVSILIIMVYYLKVIGFMISKMDLVKRDGWMVIYLQATKSLGKKKTLNCFIVLINLVIFETFSIIIFTVTVPIISQMAVSF